MEKKTIRQLVAIGEVYRESTPVEEMRQWGGVFQKLYFLAVRRGKKYGLLVADGPLGGNGSAYLYEVCGDDGRPLRVGDFDDVYKIAAKIVGLEPESWARFALWLVVLDGEFLKYQPKSIVTDSDKAREVSRLEKVQDSQALVIADIDAQLAAMVGWESLNEAHAAKKAGLIERRALVVADGVLIAEQIAALGGE